MEQIKYPTFDYEIALRDKGYYRIVGVDEAGRGSGISSVVAGAVIIPDKSVPKLLGKIRDSKKVSQKRREELYDLIKDTCDFSFGMVDNYTIDKVNILNATKMAMIEAVDRLNRKDFLLIDGNFTLSSLFIPQQSVINGDNLSVSIAAASIVAKVVRDNIVMGIHELYPQYNWDKNKGYLTKDHVEAIRKYGVTKFHRLSYNKVGRNV